MNLGGWKHGKIIEFPNEKELINTVDKNTKKKYDVPETINLFKQNKVKFIVMIKNPYMWINSMCKFRKKSVTNISFIIEKVKLWNSVYTNYKQYIENKKAYLIKYEELILNPDEILENLSKEFNLKRVCEKSFKLEKKKIIK